MASILLKPPSPPFPRFKSLFPCLPFLLPQQKTHPPIQNPHHELQICYASPSQTPYTPPSTREEAILQAKTCLSTTLQKPLNNPIPLSTRKLKKQRQQPRYRVEIPVIDDSPASLTGLVFEVFSDIPISRKGAKPTILILWPNPTLTESANRAFDSSAIVNSELAAASAGVLNSADLAVFMAPDASQLEEMKRIASDLDPRPVVLFNPNWGFEEEKGLRGGLDRFVGSFDVVYSFMGLEARGLLSRRKGVVFKCVRDGVLSGEGWVVLMEEGKMGELKVVSRMKRRPSIEEVEILLYNLMAANSPVTRSVKFLRDLASNVTGKKVLGARSLPWIRASFACMQGVSFSSWRGLLLKGRVANFWRSGSSFWSLSVKLRVLGHYQG